MISKQIYTEVNKRDSIGEHRASVATRTGDEYDESDAHDGQATLEFSTTSYAILEREQRVVLKVKRRGPVDADVRFRCLAIHMFSYRSHSCMYMLMQCCIITN